MGAAGRLCGSDAVTAWPRPARDQPRLRPGTRPCPRPAPPPSVGPPRDMTLVSGPPPALPPFVIRLHPPPAVVGPSRAPPVDSLAALRAWARRREAASPLPARLPKTPLLPAPGFRPARISIGPARSPPPRRRLVVFRTASRAPIGPPRRRYAVRLARGARFRAARTWAGPASGGGRLGIGQRRGGGGPRRAQGLGWSARSRCCRLTRLSLLRLRRLRLRRRRRRRAGRLVPPPAPPRPPAGGHALW